MNYFTAANNCRITSVSSQGPKHPATGVISNSCSPWVSDVKLPQFICLDIRYLRKSPTTYFKHFGVYCERGGPMTPKLIEIFFSKDNQNFSSFGRFSLEMKCGWQVFEIRNSSLLLCRDYAFFKLLVRQSFGGSRVSISKIFAGDKHPRETRQDGPVVDCKDQRQANCIIRPVRRLRIDYSEDQSGSNESDRQTQSPETELFKKIRETRTLFNEDKTKEEPSRISMKRQDVRFKQDPLDEYSKLDHELRSLQSQISNMRGYIPMEREETDIDLSVLNKQHDVLIPSQLSLIKILKTDSKEANRTDSPRDPFIPRVSNQESPRLNTDKLDSLIGEASKRTDALQMEISRVKEQFESITSKISRCSLTNQDQREIYSRALDSCQAAVKHKLQEYKTEQLESPAEGIRLEECTRFNLDIEKLAKEKVLQVLSKGNAHASRPRPKEPRPAERACSLADKLLSTLEEKERQLSSMHETAVRHYYESLHTGSREAS